MSEEKKLEVKHAVIYCDGGFLLDHKVGGWGVHGYTYIEEEPKRGTGNPKVIPTSTRYLFKDKGGTKVTVVNYFDMAGGAPLMSGNNEAELTAMVNAFQWLTDNPEIEEARIYTDSELIIKGILKWMSGWAARNWIKSNGEPVKFRPVWERAKTLYDTLKNRLTVFTIEHVEGHSGEPGNERADGLASRGLIMGRKRVTQHYHKVSDPQGYWNIKSTAPRILQAPRWYFSTTDLDYKDAEGTHTYFVGCHGTKDKEDDLPGKPYADNFLGVVRVTEPNPVMESLREAAIQKDKNRTGAIMIGYLDNIFNAKMYKELSEHETQFLIFNDPRLDVFGPKDLPIAIELKPLGLGFRKADIWRSLNKILNQVREQDPYYRLTEITDSLYEAPDPKKGLRKLKASITQVVKYLDFSAEFNLEKERAEPKLFDGTIRLILGEDILSRNQLAAIAEDVESVHIVTWRESDQVGRYATMVRLKTGDVGLWARFEANLYYKVG